MKSDQHNYAVILAGGTGTRFWPLSRRHKPKQFLNIIGSGTLLEATLKRIRFQFSPRNIYIVTSKNYQKEILKHAKLFKIPPTNILYEPTGKNTAPAVLWAAQVIHQKDPRGLMAVLPSDHLISNNARFLKIIDEALKLARQNFLVTLGITPTRPETGYGYLKVRKVQLNGNGIFKVERFSEKPDFSTAKKFIKSGNYYWNSGMFFWKTSVILDAFKKYLPKHFKLMAHVRSIKDIERVWPKLESISVDYGILEKADHVAAVEAKNIGWSDVGSWEAVCECLPKDQSENIHQGQVLALESRNNFVHSSARLVATIGVENLIVIDTDDALLICRNDKTQKVREAVLMLNKDRKDLI